MVRNLYNMYGPADGGVLYHVPRGEPQEIPVANTYFSHTGVPDHFKDGRAITSLVADRWEQRTTPLATPYLIIDVVWPGLPAWPELAERRGL